MESSGFVPEPSRAANNILNVFYENLDEGCQFAREASAKASFVAMDTEFSGMGKAKKIRDRDVEVRYQEMTRTVRSHSVLQLGLSFFVPKEEGSHHVGSLSWPSTNEYDVYTVNFHAFSKFSFQVAPRSLAFLVRNGLDLNRAFACGIPYRPGQVSEDAQEDDSRRHSTNQTDPNSFDGTSKLRALLSSMSDRKLPLVVHNGLFDAMFLYQSFYGQVPNRHVDFVTAFHRLFPTVFDTKHIAAAHAHERDTYLAIVYETCLRETADRESKGNPRVILGVPPAPKWQCSSCIHRASSQTQAVAAIPKDCTKDGGDDASVRQKRARDGDSADTAANKRPRSTLKLCPQYAKFGACEMGSSCVQSHNLGSLLDDEVDEEEKPDDKGTEIPKQAEPQASATTGDHVSPYCLCINAAADLHNAGYDAFCTGYIFATFLVRFKNGIWKDENRMFLPGHEIALILRDATASQFSYN